MYNLVKNLCGSKVCPHFFRSKVCPLKDKLCVKLHNGLLAAIREKSRIRGKIAQSERIYAYSGLPSRGLDEIRPFA
jgi:hypothetical protein